MVSSALFDFETLVSYSESHVVCKCFDNVLLKHDVCVSAGGQYKFAKCEWSVIKGRK